MDVKLFQIDELKPYEKNPRRNDRSVEAVAKSIEQFGFKVPIVIDANNVIVCGHTRYKAAQKLHFKSVPCIVAGDLTPEQVKAFRLADNKVSELAQWDDALLLDELGDLDLCNIDMADFGFDTSKIGSWHKSWAKTEKLCDLKKKIKCHSSGDMILTSFYQVGKKGIPIAQIKEQPTNAKLFADNLCDYLLCYAGGGITICPKVIGVSLPHLDADIKMGFTSLRKFVGKRLKILVCRSIRTSSLLKLVAVSNPIFGW